MASDHFGNTSVQTMKANIMLAFAMNLKAMSAAEVMCCVRIPAGHFGTRTMVAALNELVAEGQLERVKWEGHGWKIPGFRSPVGGALPYNEASKVMTRRDYEMREHSPYPRVKIPAERAQYNVEADGR